MSNVLRLAIVDPNDSHRESLKSMFSGIDTIWFEAECSSYEFFADVVAQTNPDIGLVANRMGLEKGQITLQKAEDRSQEGLWQVVQALAEQEGEVVATTVVWVSPLKFIRYS